MAGQQVGYRRVSSKDQNLDRQLAGIELDRVFNEKASASTAHRPELKACLDYVREGDTLHVHAMDRLARNLTDLTATVDILTASGVTVQFHNEGMAFSGKDDTPMNRFMLQMMGSFAEFERNLINERRREGQEAARAAGKVLGAPPIPEAKKKQVLELIAGGMPKSHAAKKVGISRPSLYKILKNNPKVQSVHIDRKCSRF
jgi:DNA invertase Pin-like site-specific DNA recombinase